VFVALFPNPIIQGANKRLRSLTMELFFVVYTVILFAPITIAKMVRS